MAMVAKVAQTDRQSRIFASYGRKKAPFRLPSNMIMLWLWRCEETAFRDPARESERFSTLQTHATQRFSRFGCLEEGVKSWLPRIYTYSTTLHGSQCSLFDALIAWGGSLLRREKERAYSHNRYASHTRGLSSTAGHMATHTTYTE